MPSIAIQKRLRETNAPLPNPLPACRPQICPSSPLAWHPVDLMPSTGHHWRAIHLVMLSPTIKATKVKRNRTARIERCRVPEGVSAPESVPVRWAQECLGLEVCGLRAEPELAQRKSGERIQCDHGVAKHNGLPVWLFFAPALQGPSPTLRTGI